MSAHNIQLMSATPDLNEVGFCNVLEPYRYVQDVTCLVPFVISKDADDGVFP